MALEQRLDIRLDQKLVMTPQLQLAIKLLQMSTLDLQDFVSTELTDNPFLQAEDNSTEEDRDASKDVSADDDTFSDLSSENMSDDNGLDMNWENMYDNGTSSAGGAYVDEDGESLWEKTATAEKTLKEHLQDQLSMSEINPTTVFLGNYLIDFIDDSGYFRGDLVATADKFHVELAVVEDALELIQTFDPCGVGARDLAECLCLQLEIESGLKGQELESAMKVASNLELLARRDFKKLAKISDCSLEDVLNYCEKIKTLTPKPGLQYGSDVSDAVIPDVMVIKKEDKWCAELNVDAMPKVLLNKNYQTMFEGSKGDDKSYMNERVGRAQWLIKSLEQRARTIYKTANAIIEAQRDFFDYGAESLQPLTLKQIAEKVEVHESTISRVTNGKFMQTPLGVFEMKYFFSSAIGTTGGNMAVASESVRQMIKRLVNEEDAARPLSDEKLVTILKQEGVDVARRTVAKYRESLNIPSSSKRKIRA